MTAGEATTISELWALAYPSIGSNPGKAAALQIAMWEVIGGSQFRLTSRKDYGASLLLSTVDAPGYNGPKANLIALTGPGQDFVISNPIAHPPSQPPAQPPGKPLSVPDNGRTVTLFGLALPALALFGMAKRVGNPARDMVRRRAALRLAETIRLALFPRHPFC